MANSITRQLLIDEATRRGWLVESIGLNDHFCKITKPDGTWQIFRGSRPMQTTANGMVIAKYKDLTMDFVRSLGYEVPFFSLVTHLEEGDDLLRQAGKVVVKPSDGQRSEGVTVGITDPSMLRSAIEYAQKHSTNKHVIIQQQLEGNLYRLFVLDGQLVAASHRKAATVKGDGVTSVRQLIEQLNADPRRSKSISSPLKKISIDAAESYLGAGGIERVPSAGEIVRVAAIESVSAGGESINVTDLVHEDWIRVASKIAEAAGLFVCGYDVICEDISQPLSGNFIPLLELNSSPGLKLHEYPTGGGKPIHLAPSLLDAAFKYL